MKFDKETIIVILVCMGILFGWAFVYPRYQAKNAVPVLETTAAPAVSAAPVATPQTVLPAPEAKEVTAVLPSKSDSTIKPVVSKAYSIASKNTEYFFNSNGLLEEIVLKNQKETGTGKPITVSAPAGFEPFSISIPGVGIGAVKVQKVSATELIVTREFTGSVKLIAKQTFTVSDSSNVLQSKLSLSSTSNTAVSIPRMVVCGGSLAPLKQMANDDLRDVHMLEYCLAGSRKVITVDPNAKAEKFQRGATSSPLEWVAASNKYFLSMLVSAPAFTGGCELVNPTVDSYKLPGIAGVYESVSIHPGKPFEVSYQFYLGPKNLSSMNGLPASAADALHLAYWSWLEPLCRPLLWLLKQLKDLSGSYGLAIILLTLLVKLVLWPLIHKGNKSMRRMQRVQPLVKELKEKYKDNQQEFSRQMMELYKKENVSPFGGCFPMLLQLPVFIALYSTLDSSVELRHVAFLWAQDLSRPDLVGPTVMGIGLHPFIIISTLLMVLQQKLTPPMSDPMQQKMMMFMPVIMLFFFYSFPSGLALYWTVNNVLSILQMKFSQYMAKKEEDELSKSAGNQKT